MRRPRIVPRIEGLETRDLLATGSALASALANRHAATAAAPTATTGTAAIADPPPYAPGPGDPLPIEVARTRFQATFSGPFYVGAPHYTGQSKILFFRGAGTSNQFLHGDYQMGIVLPRNPADPITGGAYMQDRNVNSAGAIALDLVADPNSLDKFGRPTVLTFSVNSNIYSGIYFNPVATGTVTIRYQGTKASVRFVGSVFTNGLTNPLRNQDLFMGRG